MPLIRLLVALGLAVGLFPPAGGVVAATSHLRHDCVPVAMDMAPSAPVDENPDCDQARPGGCDAIMGVCCVSLAAVAADDFWRPSHAETAWLPLASTDIVGVGRPPDTPPPRA